MTFNAYHVWLGILPEDQPPTHYQLLGIDSRETNIDVIDNAADRQMTHVRRHSVGVHAADCERLLNELAAARRCLIDPAARARYDSQLSLQNSAASEAMPVFDEVRLAAASDAKPTGGKAIGPRKRGKNPVVEVVKIVGGGVAGLAIGVVLIWYGLGLDPFGIFADSVEPEVASLDSGSNEIAPRNDGILNEHLPPPTSNVVPKPSPPAPVPQIVSPLPMPVDPLPQSPPPASNDNEQQAIIFPPTQANDNLEPVATSPPPNLVPEPTAAATGLTPPSAEEQQRAMATIREIFAAEYAAAESASQRDVLIRQQELAQALIRQAGEINNDPTAEFVLLREAFLQAAKGGEFRIGMQALEALQRRFVVDRFTLSSFLVTNSAEAVRSTDERLALAQLALSLVKPCWLHDRFEEASKLSDAAEALALKARNAEARIAANEMRKETSRRLRQFQQSQGAVAILKDDPANPQAHLTYGSYLCFELEQWPEGLEHLRQAGESPYAAAAQADGKAIDSKQDMVAAADAWFDLAEQNEASRGPLLARAAAWYRKALTATDGLTQVKVQKRLDDITAAQIDSELLAAAVVDIDRRWASPPSVAGPSAIAANPIGANPPAKPEIPAPIPEQAPSPQAAPAERLSVRLIHTLSGPSGKLFGVAVSPNGKLVAAGADGQNVWVWNADTGKYAFALKGHKSWLWSLSFSPDGHWLASSGGDRTVRVWNVDQRQEHCVLQGHNANVRGVRFLPDNDTIVSNSDNGQLCWWSAQSKSLIRTVHTQSQALHAMDIHAPSGKIAVANQRRLQLYSLLEGQLLSDIALGDKSSWGLACAPDGRLVAVADQLGVLHLCDLVNGRLLRSWQTGQSDLFCAAFSPDSRWLVTTGNNIDQNDVCVWDPLRQKLLLKWAAHEDQTRGAAFMPDGMRLVTVGNDGQAKIWQLEP